MVFVLRNVICGVVGFMGRAGSEWVMYQRRTVRGFVRWWFLQRGGKQERGIDAFMAELGGVGGGACYGEIVRGEEHF